MSFLAAEGASILGYTFALSWLRGILLHSLVGLGIHGTWLYLGFLVVVLGDAIRISELSSLTKRLFVRQARSLIAQSLVLFVAAYEQAESASGLILLWQYLGHDLVD